MTMHAMTLPGVTPGTSRPKCKGERCSVLIPKPHRQDTTAAWSIALSRGSEAISTYLDSYNMAGGVGHLDNCRFRDLPPSVHFECDEADEPYTRLTDEAERLTKARLRNQSPTDPPNR